MSPARGLYAYNGREAGSVVLCDIRHALQIHKPHGHLLSICLSDTLQCGTRQARIRRSAPVASAVLHFKTEH